MKGWPPGKIKPLRDAKLPGSTFQVSQSVQSHWRKYVVIPMTKVIRRKTAYQNYSEPERATQAIRN
jgi:hypothetical protein